MFVVKLDGTIASRHTLEVDATTQKAIYEGDGHSNVTIEEVAE